MNKPTLQQIPLARARLAQGAEFLRMRKSDGGHRFATCAEFPGVTFNAERMTPDARPQTPSPIFRINDVLLDGADTRERWTELCRMARFFPAGWELERSAPPAASTAEFLDGEISSGGEGMVLKPWAAPFGCGWLKAKRRENYIVRVTGFNGVTSSVFIADRDTGEPRGKVSLFGGKCEAVRAGGPGEGSILKLTGYGLTARGCIREPRPDDDTAESWLVSY